MKKIVWGIVLVSVISFVVFSSDPLNDVANFIIGGSIPGTNKSIGVWSTLLLVGILLWLVRLGFKRASLQVIEHQTKQTKAEKESTDSSYVGQFNPKQRSVIAAPKVENSY